MVVLSNARLRDGRSVDLEVVDGALSAIAPAGSLSSLPPAGAVSPVASADAASAGDHDLAGWLVVPAMAEPHAHLDKALTAEQVPNPAGDLSGAIDAWVTAARAGMFTHDDIVVRAARAMELLLANGVTAVRTHVNVGADSGATSVLALQEARAQFVGLLDVQIVALTHSPMTGSEGAGNRAALDAAVEAGVDLIGGCPHLDPDGAGLIAHALAVGVDAGLGLDLHVDEMLDPTVLFLRDLSRQMRETGFPHPVAASHCVTLGMQAEEVQASVAQEVAEAGIAVFALPQTNLFLQGRDHPIATPRGLTAISALHDAGVLVAAGADNVQDPFNSVGRSDPLETAALLVMAGHQLPDEAYDMVSNRVRRAIGLAAVEMVVGGPADLVAIDAPSVRGAVADAPMNRRVFKAGRLVAESTRSAQVYRE